MDIKLLITSAQKNNRWHVDKGAVNFSGADDTFLLFYILENVISTNDVKRILLYVAFVALCAVGTCLGNIIATRMAANPQCFFFENEKRSLFKNLEFVDKKYR